MIADYPAASVPTRVVVLSIIGVWLCYFVLVSLRGAIVGFELSWPYISRRLAVTVASMAVTGALWPLLQMLDARPLWVKACATLIGALPAALLLAAINQWAFADLDTKQVSQAKYQESISIRRDNAGNVLVDMNPPAPPAPPPPSQPGTSSTSPPNIRNSSVMISNEDADRDGPWAMLSDIASGRYFLLLAWASLYLALVNGEQARAAERRETEYRCAAEASELRSLRYQVNPHFLFNTLNSLSALVMTGKLEDAEQMIQTLSTFYRRTLSGDPTGDLPLAGEIELQQLYLDIEAVRFPQRLRRVIDLPDALADVMVPGMILQPLVENSVKYAVAASVEPVTITIEAAERAGKLVLTIADSGTITVQRPARVVTSTGIGLANVRDRLDARFGREASVDAGPLPGGGYRTIVTMPVIRDHAADPRR